MEVSMSYQWLQMRITEEQDRRKREAEILERLPRAMQEWYDALMECLATYNDSFGAGSAEITLDPNSIQVRVREERKGKWEQSAGVDILLVPKLPGFQIERGGEPVMIEIGLLPGGKFYYRDP